MTCLSVPTVSVLLPVYNAGAHLGPALDSLRVQRGVSFEVIAIDDGSSDGSRDVLESAAKHAPWLRIYQQERAGVACTLNRAWQLARGQWVARMDADDLAAPDRLQRQSEFLSAHADVGVCGSWFRTFGAGSTGIVKVPEGNDAIRARLVFGSAFAHPSVMLRRDLFADHGALYEAADEGAEDYGLWLRLAERTRFHNLPSPLLSYRQHSDQVTRRAPEKQRVVLERLRTEFWARLRIRVDDTERAAHAAVGFGPRVEPAPSTREVHAWLVRIVRELPARGWCGATALRHECAEAWWRFVAAQPRGVISAREFWRNSFEPVTLRTLRRTVQLAVRR